jgi:hypothetical protein
VQTHLQQLNTLSLLVAVEEEATQAEAVEAQAVIDRAHHSH